MVGIVIATHCNVAEAMKAAAEVVLGHTEGLEAVCIQADADRELAWKHLSDAVGRVDDGGGVLVLVDMFGGTPCNLGMALLAEGKVEVVTGVNVPMVLRAVDRRARLPLDQLAMDVLRYAQRNVQLASNWLVPNTSQGSDGQFER